MCGSNNSFSKAKNLRNQKTKYFKLISWILLSKVNIVNRSQKAKKKKKMSDDEARRREFMSSLGLLDEDLASPSHTSYRTLRSPQRKNRTPGPATPSSHEPASSLTLRERGNHKLHQKDYVSAVEWYTMALSVEPRDKLSLSNRSTAYLQGVGTFGEDDAMATHTLALKDADECCAVDPKWYKGWARRGDALFRLRRYQDALVAYKKASSLAPTNENIRRSIEKCTGRDE